jgi:hypothetical protein
MADAPTTPPTDSPPRAQRRAWAPPVVTRQPIPLTQASKFPATETVINYGATS